MRLRPLCLPRYASAVCVFLSSEPPSDSGCWLDCWEEPVYCLSPGVAGCTTRAVPTLTDRVSPLVHVSQLAGA
jgi:hypothetical protein